MVLPLAQDQFERWFMLESVWSIAERFENVYGDIHSKEYSRPQYLMELQKKNVQLFWFVLFSESLFLTWF